MTRAPWSSSFVHTGNDARTRPSSVTRARSPSYARGTFRSLRTRIRRPRTPTRTRSSTVRIGRSDGGADVEREIREPVGVAPFVVVSADHLDLVADHLGEPRVEDARARVGDDVGGDDRVLGVLQEALELALSGRLHRGVDLLDRRLATRLEGQVGRRAGGHRDPEGVAI